MTETSRLLSAARRGSAEAAEELVALVAPRLQLLIRLRMGELRTKMESADLLQSTLAKALAGMDSFESEGSGSLLAWLARIADNEVADQRRYWHRQRRDRNAEVGLEAADQLPARIRTVTAELARKDEARRLTVALEALSEEHRRVIELRELEGLAYSTVAERLGRASPDAARMLYTRAMAALSREYSRGGAR